MQRLLLDYPPAYFVLCLALGVGYAWLLYSGKYHWSKGLNRVLFGLRALLATALLVLLLGPVLRQVSNSLEKPTLVFLIDNSRSIRETTDTTNLLATLERTAGELGGSDWQVEFSTLDGSAERKIAFDHGTSDLASSLKQLTNRFEGRNLGGIVLVSDGIYNSGTSPLYQPLRVPVFTVGVGDTIQRADFVLKNVSYNRVVYQGNKFPLRAEVGINALPNEEVTVSVRQQGVVVQQQTKNSGSKALLEFDFQMDAAKPGMQRLEIRVSQHGREINGENNRGSAFVEVVEGKKKIVVLAAAPHPDIKTLRSVVEKNPNYEFLVHIPGVNELSLAALDPKEIDLLIAHQSPDNLGRTTGILGNLLKAKVPVLVVVGEQTQLRSLNQAGIPVTFEPSGQRDEVQPVLNAAFQDLGFSQDVAALIARYPPVSVPFGKFTFPATAKSVMLQQIGNLVTERPLLFTLDQEGHKLGVVIGDGVWRWRLGEYQETGKTAGFDEWMSKLIQYLSTRDDRRRFRAFPIQQEFGSDGPAVLESQVYNELFEPVYGNTVDLELTGEGGTSTRYRYVTGPASGSRYRIGGLREGIYRFTAITEIGGKRETAKGEFLVVEQSQEARNLTADFGLLRKLSEGTEGKFYRASELDVLARELSTRKAVSTLHSEESFNPLINLKAVFFLLLVLVSTEWFLRKFAGSY
jgi:hypothetical protein